MLNVELDNPPSIFLPNKLSLTAARPRKKQSSERKLPYPTRILPTNEFLVDYPSRLTPHSLANYFIRPRQHVGRNRHADLIRGFQIEKKLEFRRLLDRQIGRFEALHDFVHMTRSSAI